jgi:hypothetical protein
MAIAMEVIPVRPLQHHLLLAGQPGLTTTSGEQARLVLKPKRKLVVTTR